MLLYKSFLIAMQGKEVSIVACALTGPLCILLGLRGKKCSRQLRLMLHIVKVLSDSCHLSLYVSAAFLGDIALDEEDLQMFKVDRIIDLVQRTVKIINHTESGKKVTQQFHRC